MLGVLLVLVFFPAQAKPNVMVILVDDMGYSDLGSYGGEIQTPVLDKLAGNGLRYTQFYNTARCWPTRSALLTGYYPQQINRDSVEGIRGGHHGKRPHWAQLIPRYLKKAGYRSYHMGKWHIDGMPIKNGFDHSFYLKDQLRFFNPQLLYEDDKKLPKVKHTDGFYGTTAVADYTIKYLKEHQKQYSDKPFFAYVAFAAPHFPLHALPEDIQKVGDRYAQGWDVIRRDRWKRQQKEGLMSGDLSPVERNLGPPYHFPKALTILGKGEVNRPIPWDSLTEQQKEFQQDKMTIHAAMIERVDYEIGRIVAQIKAMKAYEDTVIFFLSDNGASAEIMVRGDGHDPKVAPGSADSYLCLGPGWATVCNTPFRKHKTWTHEGGACTPLVVHWPQGIKSQGALRRNVGHVIDILPTVLDLAGVKIPHPKVPFPGESLVPTFNGAATERTLWWSHEGNNALRAGNWKLVKAAKENGELFNLASDRTECVNLASKYPEKVSMLEAQWSAKVDDFRKIVAGGSKKKSKKK